MTTAVATPRRSFWNRELTEYPKNSVRYFCLAIVVIATVCLYYQLYLAGGLSVQILQDLHMTFKWYINMSVVGYILGALSSAATGVADKTGRANIIVLGLFAVSIMCAVGVPLIHDKWAFAIVFTLIGMVEGVILVATPALIRDFSPQLGRAAAMGFWTLGPVLGSLAVAIQVSAWKTSPTNIGVYHAQYLFSGIIGLVLTVVAGLWLRELSPNLRQQLMVSEEDQALLAARAKGIDVEAGLQRPLAQMLKPDIIISALSISVFLLFYYMAVGFFPVIFQTVMGYDVNKANEIGNWTWALNAATVVLAGIISDRLRVRKPLMLIGALVAIGVSIGFLYAVRSVDASTHVGDPSTTTWIVFVCFISFGLGLAYAPWMASFSETVEARNPALAATGLAVWGLTIRIVIAVSAFIMPFIVPSANTLVQEGPVVLGYFAQHPDQYAASAVVPAKVDPETLAALTANPNDTAAGIKAISELTGLDQAAVGQVALVSASLGTDLVGQLAANPTDPSLQVQAISKLSGVPAADLATALTSGAVSTDGTVDAEKFAALPPAIQQELASNQDNLKAAITNLTAFGTNGKAVSDAQAQLVAAGSIPPNIVELGGKLTAAQKVTTDEWSHYIWITIGGMIFFIPCIWLLTGRWSPKRARQDEEEHEALIRAELAKLNA